MADEKDKEKNIKDLEYNHLLNKQNIFLGLIGTAIISVVLTEKIPEILNVTKNELLLFLFAIAVGVLLYFGKKLEDKTNEIREL